MTIGHRDLRESDLAFVRDSWVRSFRDERAAGVIPMRLYRDLYNQIVTEIIARDGCRTLIAHSEDDPDTILGWICFERGLPKEARGRLGRAARDEFGAETPVIHYLNVKQLVRKHGVATYLLWAAGIDLKRPFFYTFQTADLARLGLSRRYPDGRYNPLIARFPKEVP